MAPGRPWSGQEWAPPARRRRVRPPVAHGTSRTSRDRTAPWACGCQLSHRVAVAVATRMRAGTLIV